MQLARVFYFLKFDCLITGHAYCDLMNKPHIVIVWASFAWLSSYLVLRKRLWNSIHITLLDKREDFTYICGLHETLFAPEKLKWLQFHLPTYYKDFQKADIKKISKDKKITLESWEKITCDYVIIATWSWVNYFWNESFQKHSHILRRAEDVEPLNKALESAENIAVIWWGFTWIEIAATIAQKKKASQSISLIDAEDRLFHQYIPKVSSKIQNWLKSKWVKLYLGTLAESIDESEVLLQNGNKIPSDCTILSSWISINNKSYSSELTFESSYTSKEDNNIYICGDNALFGLKTTAHNAMIEWRHIGHLVSDQITWTKKTYKPLVSREILALALGTRDGMFTNKTNATYIPFLTGISKKIVEKRIMFEFKHKVMLWV